MSKIWETGTLVKDGVTYYLKDIKARALLEEKLGGPLKIEDGGTGANNAADARANLGIVAGNIWYAVCSTAAGTGAKTATSSTGDFELKTGSMVRLKCTTSNTAANPTLSIDGSTAKTIQPKSGTSGMAYRWRAQEVIDLVYDGSNFIMSLGPEADTSFYGITKLNSSTSSTSTTEAATPSAVKEAYDLADGKVSKAGDTMSGELENTSYFTRKISSAPTAGTLYYATRIKDQNNTYRGGIGLYRSSTYGDGIRILHAKTVNGTTISHGAALYIGDSGTPYVVFGYPEAWRDGLGVSADYKAGDTVVFGTTGNDLYNRFAGDWRTATDLWFTIPLTKPCDGLTAAVSGSFMVCSNGSRTSVSISNVTATCYTSPCGVIVHITYSSAPAYAVLYQPVTVQPYGLTLTFS